MIRWNGFIAEDAIAALLPVEYSRFARPIRDGLTRFLEGLPESHQVEMFAAQATLPTSATLAERLGRLARSSPVLQKLGQTLARDNRLSHELRHQLRQLESLPPTVPMGLIRQQLTRELGDLERRGVTLEPPAIAEASVAVVIPYTQSRGELPHHGVFKLLKPGIEERLDAELRVLEQVGEYLDQRCDELGIPHLEYEDSFSFVTQKLAEETLLRQEQLNLSRAQTMYANEPDVVIPRLYEHCTRRVTAMERITGGKIADHGIDAAGPRYRMARLLTRALLAKPIFATTDDGLFHADPHAGNLFLTHDNRLAILDWSLAGVLGKRERIAIVQLILAACTLNAPRMMSLLDTLQERGTSDQVALQRVIDAALRRIRRGELPGMTWLTQLLDDAVQLARVRLSADLMLFRKSLHTLEGVLADTGPRNFNLDEVLMADAVCHFLRELPQRLITLPHVRDFATRLSSFDLLRTCWSGPVTCTRFWLAQFQDLLHYAQCGAR